MTTYYDFTPSSSGPFQFQPTLDGLIYNIVVTWLLFGQRYYVNVFDLAGNWIVTLPVIGSDAAFNIEGIVWGQLSPNVVTVTTATPHGIAIGKVATLTVSGNTPDAYNGTFICNISGPSTIQYSLSVNPGQATVLGTIGYNIDILAGYFSTSTLVFREGTSQFEVNP